jgi:hypothetical protein
VCAGRHYRARRLLAQPAHHIGAAALHKVARQQIALFFGQVVQVEVFKGRGKQPQQRLERVLNAAVRGGGQQQQVASLRLFVHIPNAIWWFSNSCGGKFKFEEKHELRTEKAFWKEITVHSPFS